MESSFPAALPLFVTCKAVGAILRLETWNRSALLQMQSLGILVKGHYQWGLVVTANCCVSKAFTLKGDLLGRSLGLRDIIRAT